MVGYARLPRKWYLCSGNAGKGPESQMSDECLMKGKPGFPYCGGCQAVRRKFTLAYESFIIVRIMVRSDINITMLSKEIFKDFLFILIYGVYNILINILIPR